MTSLDNIYAKFLNKIEEDDWDDPSQLEVYQERWRMWLDSAISSFKFPRVPLTISDDEQFFINDLNVKEIEILTDFMKVEWLQANVLTWEKIKTDYGEKDFSQANLLDKLDKTLKTTISRAEKRESNYYRLGSDGKPFDYTQLAGGKDG